jgi:alkylation response protein AidB-like acyl-CoA dehydrogenase
MNDPRSFRRFVSEEIAPLADANDRDEQVPPGLIRKLAGAGFLGALVSTEFGGSGLDWPTFGLLNRELGRACTGVRSLVTVQSMVTQVLERQGNAEQRDAWLRPLAAGERIAGFALTEPEHGSDAAGIQTAVVPDGDVLRITGRKKWISFGRIADLFLVFGRLEGKLCALVVERDRPGLTVTPLTGILGARASMLAELRFDDCRVPAGHLVSRSGLGLPPVTFAALDTGRYSIAWGCVGMAEACLEAADRYARSREQFGRPIGEHQLIQALLADMITDIRAARLLCEQAGRLKAAEDRCAMRELLLAKYYAARMAVRVAARAVEIHGANGFSRACAVERFYRDAKIMETIEGSNQMMQVMIARYGYENYFKDD